MSVAQEKFHHNHRMKEDVYLNEAISIGNEPRISTDGLFRREFDEKHKKPEHRHPRQNSFQLQGKGTGLSSNASTIYGRPDAPLGHGIVSFPL